MGDKLKLALVSFGFLGCSPFAPGTFGTLGRRPDRVAP
jgi:hypothetical protein